MHSCHADAFHKRRGALCIESSANRTGLSARLRCAEVDVARFHEQRAGVAVEYSVRDRRRKYGSPHDPDESSCTLASKLVSGLKRGFACRHLLARLTSL